MAKDTVKHFDDVFQYVGWFSVYQIVQYSLLLLVAVFSVDSMYVIFLVYEPDHWCKVPKLAEFPHEIQLNVAIPYDEDYDPEVDNEPIYSSCSMYALNYSQYDTKEFLTWNRSDYVNTETVDCTQWEYDESVWVESIVDRWDLVCDSNWKANFVDTATYFGLLIGTLVTGQCSDRFGRKKVLLLSLSVKVIGCILSAAAPSYPLFVLARMLQGGGGTGAYTCSFIIAIELVSSKYRSALGMGFGIGFSLGYMLTPTLAYFVRDYVKLQAIYTAPVVLFFSYWWLIDESPRWLLAVNRSKEAEKILRKIAAVNGRTLPDDFTLEHLEVEKKDPSTATFTDLFKTPLIRRRTLVFLELWFTTSLLYVALSLNVGNLSGGIFLNTLLMAVVEIPASLVSVFLMNWRRTGRRLSTALWFFLGGLFSLISVLLIIADAEPLLVTLMSILGKAASSAAFNGLYVFTSELYPTEVRNVGMATCNVAARISGMIAPIIGDRMGDVWAPLPSLIFGVLGILSAVLSVLQPESLGHIMCDTIEELENTRDKAGDVLEDMVVMSDGKSKGDAAIGKKRNKVHAADNETFEHDVTL